MIAGPTRLSSPAMRTFALPFVTAAALLLAAARPAAAGDEPRSAIVIVVENNDQIATGGRDPFLRALDALGEPIYARALKRAARRHWDEVVVLSDARASFANVAARLRDLDARGFAIDLVLDIHGSSAESKLDNRTTSGPDKLYFSGKPATADDVRALGKPRPLRLNSVYMVSCWGSRFNDAWIAAGARAANRAAELNYYVLQSPLRFIEAYGGGLDLAAAATTAYAGEKALLDRAALDRALASIYGRAGAARIHGARSSERVHAGEARVLAACRRSVTP